MKFRVGDVVRVKRGLPVDRYVSPTFTLEMTGLCGKRAIVKEITIYDTLELSVGYYWRPEWLELDYIATIKELLT